MQTSVSIMQSVVPLRLPSITNTHAYARDFHVPPIVARNPSRPQICDGGRGAHFACLVLRSLSISNLWLPFDTPTAQDHAIITNSFTGRGGEFGRRRLRASVGRWGYLHMLLPLQEWDPVI